MKPLASRLWIHPHLPTRLPGELLADALLKSVTAGFLIYVLEIMIAISFAAFIFSGDLKPQLPYAIGFIVAGDALLCMVVALLSSYPGSIAVEQDAPSAVLASVAIAILATLPAGTSPEQRFTTIVMMLVAATVLTGLCFILLGKLKLGGLVRFLPYPVMGGFLTGTGWLLATGGIGVMANTSSSLDLVGSDTLLRWLPGVILGVIMLLAVNRFKGPYVLPAICLGAAASFYAIAWLTQTPLAQLSSEGWLLGPFPSGSLWRFPLTTETLSQANWSVLLMNLPQLAPVALISVIALLLNVNGLELIVKQDLNPNHELVAAGLGNVAAGLVGGIVGYHALSLTSLNHAMSGTKRLPGLMTALLIGLTVFVGASVLNYIPKMILGALLIFLGLSFLVEWLYHAWFKFPRVDFVIIVLIMGTIAVRGFLEGIAIGLVLTIIIFVVNYSRINVVRHTLSGANLHSTLDRPPSQRDFLRQHGEQLWIFQLQGYIFFGTAQRLVDQVRLRVANETLPRLCFMVLDFARVNGLDSSAVSSFVKLKQFAEAHTIQLVLTSLSSAMQCQLERGGLAKSPIVCQGPTLDAGVEWCEEQILATAEPLICDPQDSLENQLGRVFHRSSDIARLMDYLEKEAVGAAKLLIRQGDPPDAIYFIESGLATAQLELPDGRSVRLRTMRCGTIIGEVGLYLGTARTATVLTTEPSTLYRLSADAIRRMEEQDPEIAAALHKWIARLMAERLAENNNTLAAMLD
jgi:SulP family sulfate permease